MIIGNYYGDVVEKKHLADMKSALVDGEQSYEYYKQERESMKFQKRLDNKIYTYKEADKPIPIKKSWGIGWYDNVKLIGWIAKGKSNGKHIYHI